MNQGPLKDILGNEIKEGDCFAYALGSQGGTLNIYRLKGFAKLGHREVAVCALVVNSDPFRVTMNDANLGTNWFHRCAMKVELNEEEG